MRIITIFVLSVITVAIATGHAAAQEEPSPSWQYYQGTNGQFFAEFPTVPRKSGGPRTISEPVNETSATLYRAFFNRTYFFVFTCASTKCPVFDVVNKLKFRARNVAASKLTEVRRDDSVTETTFGDSDGFFHKIRQFSAGKLNFVAHTVSELNDDPLADRFLNSLKLTPPEEKALEPDPETFDKPLSTERLRPEPTTNVRREPETLKEPKTPFMPVSILAKPRASYTDAASVYGITGDVLLRVKFLASGTVAEVTAIRKLPFGLTEQAKIAAEGIRFEPALREGKRVDTVRPITYTFSIN